MHMAVKLFALFIEEEIKNHARAGDFFIFNPLLNNILILILKNYLQI
jgi:hypothetical protein